MNNNPNSYNLNQEYRNRQMERASRVQKVNEVVGQEEGRPNPIFQANLISVFWIVISILALILFFGVQPTQAQEQMTVDNGSDAAGEGMVVYLYLRATITAIEEGDFESAEEFLNHALDVDPDFAAAYVGLSYLNLAQGQPEAALANANIAYELNPDDAAVYFVLAEAYFAMSDYVNAQIHYETYIAMVETSGEQPLLITLLHGAGSMDIVTAHLATSRTEIAFG